MTVRIFRTVFFLVLPLFLLRTQTEVIHDSLAAPTIQSYSHVTIILPEGYQGSKQRYASLYLLHGFNQNHTSWVNSTRLAATAQRYKLIIVCIDAKNSWYTNSVTTPALRYEELLVKDVIPFIDKRYRTIPDGRHRSVRSEERRVGKV